MFSRYTRNWSALLCFIILVVWWTIHFVLSEVQVVLYLWCKLASDWTGGSVASISPSHQYSFSSFYELCIMYLPTYFEQNASRENLKIQPCNHITYIHANATHIDRQWRLHMRNNENWCGPGRWKFSMKIENFLILVAPVIQNSNFQHS